MITRADIKAVGKVNKTHGIDGELSVSFFDEEVIDALHPDDCLFFDIDGIFVPFFVKTVRPRGNESLLITLYGEMSREDVTVFVGKDVFMGRDWLANVLDEDSAEGLYAGALIGFFALTVEGNVIGRIVDIDDNADNPLFIIKNSETEKSSLIPIVDDFIKEIGDDSIVFDLPDGLLDL